MTFEIRIDKDKCIGCGGCEAVCPKNFKMVNGKASVKKGLIDSLDCEEDAKDACPVGAISITKK